MALSKAKIEAAKPQEKPYRLSDGGGLHLLVSPSGNKAWRFRYRKPTAKARSEGKGRQGRPENMLSFGPYPEVTLAVARDRALDARRLLEAGKDPATEAESKRSQQENTFEAVAREWMDKMLRGKGNRPPAPITRTKAEWIFNLVLPDIGSRPIAEIDSEEVRKSLEKISARGHHESAHRAKQRIGQVFRYAAATGRAKHDPTGVLRGALVPIAVTHHASLKDPARVGALLRAITGYDGQPVTAAALKLAPLVFVRPGELRAAEWAEFALDGNEPTWRIPGPKMKEKLEHIVPLSKQAVAIVRELQPLTGSGKYLFPSLRTHDRPMSNNTVNAALRRLGYSGDQMTGHGFRSTASTLLNEQHTPRGERRFSSDWIERQLAHVEGNKVRGAYNAAEYLPQRRKMMQWWADYLDTLKAGSNVVSITSKTRA